MDKSFETSFIPQQSLLRVEGREHHREPVNLALLLAFIVFFVSVAVAGGMYFFDVQAEHRVEAKRVQLKDAEKLFNSGEIDTYKQIATRLKIAKQLVDNHAIFSVILDLLESQSAQNIGLTSLAYGKSTAGYTLALGGQATSYGAVYFQAETWRAAAPFVKSVDIASMTLDEQTGVVTFDAQLVLDPAYMTLTHVITTQMKAQTAAMQNALPLPPSASSTPAGT